MTAPAQRPATATTVGVVLLAEGALMVAVGIWLAIVALGESMAHIGGTIFLALLCIGAAFFLLQAGRAMLDGRAWSRSAAVVWQILQAGVAFGTYNGAEGPVPLALSLLVPPAVVLLLVFRKSVSAWLQRGADDRVL